MTKSALYGIGALAAASVVLAQKPQPQQNDAINLRGELVVLDAQVVNKKTALAVKGLTSDDFLLYEDGVKQHISHFSQDQLPLSVLILLDVSGSVFPNRKSFERLWHGALEALNQLRPEDEVAVMQFAGSAKLLQPFTRNRDAVLEGLGRLNGRAVDMGTNVDKAILEAALYMRSASNSDSRRAIIALTDDMNVEFRRRPYALPGTMEENRASRELFEAGTVVCALLYRSELRNLADPAREKGAAARAAQATGGILIRTSQDDVSSRLSEMIERLRQRYTIDYSPTNSVRDGKFRKIRLKVSPRVDRREGGVVVITRRGYYAK